MDGIKHAIDELADELALLPDWEERIAHVIEMARSLEPLLPEERNEATRVRGELFRMVINYDQERTDGLSDEDMVAAISARYGIAARPAATVVHFSSSQVYNDSQRVIARWEDSQFSFSLFRYSCRPTFGMVAFSKQLDTLAQAAVVEGFRLDKKEAP